MCRTIMRTGFDTKAKQRMATFSTWSSFIYNVNRKRPLKIAKVKRPRLP